jgi:hypothetical protein
MDALYRTPLLDCFRRGEVASDVRMLAAQGVLAPRAHEQLGLLVLLSGDADPAIRAAASATLDRIPPRALARFLGRSDVPEEIRGFFARRGVEADAEAAEPSDAPLLEPEGAGHEAADDPAADAVAGDEPRLATVQRLSRMNVTEKIKAAMRGSREERSILIRDPNKLVSISVLSSPKVSEQEVEAYARMASISEDVLRVIGSTRAWVKTYSIVKNLTFNPKTPVAVSMGFVNRLVEKDVKALATDRNIPEPVKILARKLMQAGQSRKH